MIRHVRVRFTGGRATVNYQVDAGAIFTTDVGADRLLRLRIEGAGVDIELSGIEHITIGEPERRQLKIG